MTGDPETGRWLDEARAHLSRNETRDAPEP
jgi:hypothetical protein